MLPRREQRRREARVRVLGIGACVREAREVLDRRQSHWRLTHKDVLDRHQRADR